jgi:Zn-dependent peptidase ImmA (M78 family)
MRNRKIMYSVLEKIQDEKEKRVVERYLQVIPLDIVGLAKELELTVKESLELPDKVSGFIKKIHDTVLICVNERHSLNRKRFTVAHELGHYFLHNERLDEGIVDGIDILYRDGTLDEIEKQANEFAANILMPEIEFRKLWAECTTIQDIATYFYVSESAIITRAKFLKLAKEDSTYFA